LRVDTAIGGKDRQISEQSIQAGPAGTTFSEQVIDPEHEEYCDRYNPPRGSGIRVTLLFVGNDYVAYRYESWSDCGARPTSNSSLLVRAIDQLDTQRISIEELTGPEGLIALQKGASAFLDTIPPGERDGYYPALGNDWGLVRKVGGWRLIGHLGPARATARSANTEYEISLSPPETLVGEGVPSRLLDIVRKKVPNTSDLFLAPGRSHLVVLTPGVVHVYRVNDGVLGPDPVLLAHPEFDAIDAVVMVQWSVGRHVSRWTEEIGNLLQKE
jgi:hypothetical protein